mmetsp:Transcript_36584/g.78007  ORF Transcript_36584/g.78007 Transcript_36584/m.78007 type:complete len:176 (-) Transcript_36584:616-1143(-)
MIVLGGIAALETANPDLELPFCGGYVDAEDGAGSEGLEPRVYETPYVTVTDDYLVKGLSMEQGVALASAPVVTSQWYKDLQAAGEDSAEFGEYDRALLEGDLLQYVKKFADDEAALRKAFESGWTYMMTADRYGEFNKNACAGIATPTLEEDASGGAVAKTSLGGIVVAGLLALI